VVVFIDVATLNDEFGNYSCLKEHAPSLSDYAWRTADSLGTLACVFASNKSAGPFSPLFNRENATVCIIDLGLVDRAEYSQKNTRVQCHHPPDTKSTAFEKSTFPSRR
jgi:hypothetical protein